MADRLTIELENTGKLENMLAEERNKMVLAQTVHKGKASNSLMGKVEYTEEVLKF